MACTVRGSGCRGSIPGLEFARCVRLLKIRLFIVMLYVKIISKETPSEEEKCNLLSRFRSKYEEI